METDPPVRETLIKKNQTPLIIAAAVIVLCCCCVLLAAAGYYGFVRNNRSQGVPPQPVEDAVPTLPGNAQSPTVQPSSGAGEAPTGGLGNDVLRNDTWQYVAAAAQGQGCDQPIGAHTTIDVLQEPQQGVWVEQWNVACASGDSYSYEVQFTLDDTGATFDIKPLQ